MVSIITCSINRDICEKMLDSVSKTIGTEYEAIVFDNREKKYGLCKAYNEAAKSANGDYLCFVHEDIEIKTEDWGKELIKFTNETENCGVIGLAGCCYVRRNFIGHWQTDPDARRVRIYHKRPHDNFFSFVDRNPNKEIFSRVVCLDGVFLFVKKRIWQKNVFDERTFKGFHFYDADFSFTIAQNYQNYVYFGMDVYHFSMGNHERTFCENMYLFQQKWRKQLPHCLQGYNVSLWEELVASIGVFLLYKKNEISIIERFKRINEINNILFFMLFIFFLIMFGFCKKLKTFVRKGIVCIRKIL